MIRKILGIILLAPAALAEIRPDVSFTGENDRFDLSAMVKARNKMFRDTPQVDDDEDDEGGMSDGDSRRNMQIDAEKDLRDIHPPRAILTRREDIDFAYDPDNLPVIGRAGDNDMVDLEYQENLKRFKTMIPQPGRRKTLTDEQKHENEVLMQNVVPIVMEVDGYLKAPLQKLVQLYADDGKRVILKMDS